MVGGKKASLPGRGRRGVRHRASDRKGRAATQKQGRPQPREPLALPFTFTFQGNSNGDVRDFGDMVIFFGGIFGGEC